MVNNLSETTIVLQTNYYTEVLVTVEKYFLIGTQAICIKYNPGVPFNSGAGL